MISTFLLLAAQAPVAPSVPPGMNSAFVQTAYKAEHALGDGDFDLAEKETSLLPSGNIRFRWDDSAVSEEDRPAFRKACQSALTEWTQAIPMLRFSEDDHSPNIVFSFTGSLPLDKGSPFPAGVELAFHDQPEPRMTDRIAMERMSPPTDVYDVDVHNEVAFAVAQYLGLEETPRFLGFSSRTNQNTSVPVRATSYEQALGKAALDLADQLRALATAHQKVTVGQPIMALTTGSISNVTGFQDEPKTISFDVLNKGTSDLRLFVLPDCSCLAPSAPPVVKAGGKATVYVGINTAVYTGRLSHSLMIYSNDPDWSIDQMPVTMYIEPLFHFFKPGPSVVEVGAKGASVDGYMVLSSKADMTVLTASLAGIKANVKFHPWSGELPEDPDSKGALVKGYKVHIDVAPTHIGGQFPATLVMGTTNPDFREIMGNLIFQSGVVAIPGEVYFGPVSNTPKTFVFRVSRPSGSLKILKVDTGSPFFSATVSPTENEGESKVSLVYDGKASFGKLTTTLKVYVNDPDQPIVSVPVEADVK